MRRLSLLILLFTSCTGLSMGENQPGDDTWLEAGSIAVDPNSETAFVMSASSKTSRKALFAIAPSGSPQRVADLTGQDNSRLLFPSSGLLLMSVSGEYDQLQLLDPSTFATIKSTQTVARYNGTRMSPSRQWIAVANNADAKLPIHLIDAQSLAIHPIPHDGEWLEAMWLHTTDRLLAIVFYAQSTPSAYARVLSWSMADLEAAGFPAQGPWSGASIDLMVPGARYDQGFSYTWVGVSADDRVAVFPVQRLQGGSSIYQLLVVDLATGTMRTFDDARGPVGFTPDGSGIVSYRYTGNIPDLLVIDRDTLAATVVPLPQDGLGPSYFVTREGNVVVVTSTLGQKSLLLYDLDQGKLTQLGGPHLELTEFVSRVGHDELWLIDAGLYRLDFMAMALDKVNLSWTPEHINILPMRDRLVLDDAAGPTIRFFDPQTRTVTRQVTLPSP